MAVQLLASLAALPLLAAEPLSTVPAALQEPTPAVWIGVSLTEDDEEGLAITTVHEDSPARRSGLLAGDRILAAGDTELGSFQELLGVLAGRRPGSHLKLWIQREVTVELDSGRQRDGRPLLGVIIDEADGGALVTEAQEGFPARRAGFRKGDVLRSVDGVRVRSVDDLIESMAGAAGAEAVRVGFGRGIDLVLAARPGAASAPEPAPEPRFRRRRVEPGPVFPPEPSGSLREELRELAADLRALREEIAQLRAELDRLRRGRGR